MLTTLSSAAAPLDFSGEREASCFLRSSCASAASRLAACAASLALSASTSTPPSSFGSRDSNSDLALATASDMRCCASTRVAEKAAMRCCRPSNRVDAAAIPRRTSSCAARTAAAALASRDIYKASTPVHVRDRGSYIFCHVTHTHVTHTPLAIALTHNHHLNEFSLTCCRISRSTALLTDIRVHPRTHPLRLCRSLTCPPPHRPTGVAIATAPAFTCTCTHRIPPIPTHSRPSGREDWPRSEQTRSRPAQEAVQRSTS